MSVANVYMGAVVAFYFSRANMPEMNRMNRNANRPVNGSSLYRLLIYYILGSFSSLIFLLGEGGVMSHRGRFILGAL